MYNRQTEKHVLEERKLKQQTQQQEQFFSFLFTYNRKERERKKKPHTVLYFLLKTTATRDIVQYETCIAGNEEFCLVDVERQEDGASDANFMSQ